MQTHTYTVMLLVWSERRLEVSVVSLRLFVSVKWMILPPLPLTLVYCLVITKLVIYLVKKWKASFKKCKQTFNWTMCQLK